MVNRRRDLGSRESNSLPCHFSHSKTVRVMNSEPRIRQVSRQGVAKSDPLLLESLADELEDINRHLTHSLHASDDRLQELHRENSALKHHNSRLRRQIKLLLNHVASPVDQINTELVFRPRSSRNLDAATHRAQRIKRVSSKGEQTGVSDPSVSSQLDREAEERWRRFKGDARPTQTDPGTVSRPISPTYQVSTFLLRKTVALRAVAISDDYAWSVFGKSSISRKRRE